MALADEPTDAALRLLVSELPSVEAARALGRLARDVESEDAIREAGGIEALAALVSDPAAADDAVEAACAALQNLASDDNEENQRCIRECGGLEALVKVLDRPGCRRAASATLRNLRTDPTNAKALDVLDKVAGRDYARQVVLPDNWDHEVKFTDELVDEAVLDRWAIHVALRAPPQPTSAVRIETVTRGPCLGQRGLFAAEALEPGTMILRYCGVVKPRLSDDDSDYLFALEQTDVHIDIDACRAGNESRFINDHRGSTERPNVQFVEARTEAGALEVWVQVLTPIAEKEEILVSYGGRYFAKEGAGLEEEP